MTMDAINAARLIKKWADYHYNHSGDSQEVCLCDKWNQKLNDQPQSLEKLMKNPLFLSILTEAIQTFGNI